MGGAVKVKRAEYFLSSFIRMHGEDVTLFGDGYNETIFLQRPYTLTDESLNTARMQPKR